MIAASDLKFFERKIRPILVQHCYECHSAESEELGGQLLLDTRQGLLKGGETGPVITGIDPKQSLLIQALRYDGVEMPPDQPLPEAVIRDFEDWVRRGTPDSRLGEVENKVSLDPDTLWSFLPRQPMSVPDVLDETWPRDRIDRFVLANLEDAGIRPTNDADPRTLLRRLFIDLIGLPPTFKEIESFRKDFDRDGQEAVERVVDDLLIRPQFGERWGRHWLDVARYGESNGDDGLGRNATFPHAWRYRDYVIDAFNRDTPYDEFLIEQIAGDLLPAENAEQRNRQLIATGFLAIGSKPASAMNKNFAMDIVEDQIDVIGAGILGLSIACARCHDHKHDPIPTRDYYSLAGFFTSTETLYGLAANEKLTAPPTELHELVSYWPQQHQETKEFKLGDSYSVGVDALNPTLHESLVLTPSELEMTGDVTFSPESFAATNSSMLKGQVHGSGENYSVSFWFRNRLNNNLRPITAYLFSRAEIGNKQLPGDHIGIGGNHDSSRTGKLFVFNGNEKKQSLAGQTIIAEGTWNHVVMVRNEKQVQLFLNGSETPEVEGEIPATFGDSTEFCLATRSDEFAPLDGNLAEFAFFDRALISEEIDQLHAMSGQPKSHPHIGLAMGVRDRSEATDCKIHVNGDVAKLGSVVPRGVLSIYGKLGTDVSKKLSIPQLNSGRLELAKWLTDPDHPQTARVMVNRIWSHLFGQGLVSTPNDFGVYGSRPTHPKLLDDLAQRFVDGGWSMKGLIRQIVLSRTYQLDSRVPRLQVNLDPENQLYTRHLRRRMDAETIRDAMLQASGSLDLQPKTGSVVSNMDQLINWPPGEATQLHQFSNHRSVYLCMLRHAPPLELAAFNLPDGVEVVGMREQTVLPTQSLFLMNNPFVVKQAMRMAEEITANHERTVAECLDEVFKRTMHRLPDSRELEQSKQYLQSIRQRSSHSSESEREAWTAFCHAMMMTNEFRYID